MLQDTQARIAVAARLQEFWGEYTPWQRRLWNVGTVSALREVAEASTAVSESVLSKESLKRLQSEVAQLVGPDPGVGDSETHRVLQRLLRGDLTAGRVEWHELLEIAERIEDAYLQRWAAFARGSEQQTQERAARYVASHLLEAGFAATYLHRWLQYRISPRSSPVTLSEILEEAAADLARRPPRSFEVFVPCLSVPRISAEDPPAGWLSAIDMSKSLTRVVGNTSGVRHNGGFAINVTARDPYAAVEQAREAFDRWAARVELATPQRLAPSGTAWVDGVSRGIPFADERRQIEIGALERETRLYAPLDDSETALRLDDALQLAQPLASGPRAAAISGGWAAVESLLTAPGEARGIAAARLASIVTCSFPRAELTTLAYQHQNGASDNLARRLSEEADNLGRARLVAEAILAGASLHGRGPVDDAAYYRMTQVLHDPRGTLSRIRSYLAGALNRLYRQRNLILHGGRVSGEGRAAALRTAPPLVGAGLDRLAHAWFVEGTSPLELTARADLNLALLGTDAARPAFELLEDFPD